MFSESSATWTSGDPLSPFLVANSWMICDLRVETMAIPTPLGHGVGRDLPRPKGKGTPRPGAPAPPPSVESRLGRHRSWRSRQDRGDPMAANSGAESSVARGDHKP